MDNISLAANSKEFIKTIKDLLYSNFDKKNMGKATYILKVKIYKDNLKKLPTLSQKPYI